jgi:hypothetical protein
MMNQMLQNAVVSQKSTRSQVMRPSCIHCSDVWKGSEAVHRIDPAHAKDERRAAAGKPTFVADAAEGRRNS